MSDMLYILGASLAQAIGEEEILCRGVLRLAVTSSVDRLRKAPDPSQAANQTIAYLKNMTYQDWKVVIQGPMLSQSLASIGVKGSPAVVARLMQTLIEQQSLFTMTAH